MFYFAYGLNLDPVGMEGRCSGCRRIGKAILKNYRLCFWNGCATIVESEDSVVWGALYEINETTHLQALDQLEGYPDFYNRIEVKVKIEPFTWYGKTTATAYQMKEGVRAGQLSPGYLAVILRGCRDWDIPSSYIEEVEKLAMT